MAHHVPPSSSEVRNVLSYIHNSTILYIMMCKLQPDGNGLKDLPVEENILQQVVGILLWTVWIR